MKDYYSILGVNEDSNDSEIKSAFRKLSKKYHPDKNENDRFFEEKFKHLKEAYDILSSKDSRSIYDSKRKDIFHKDDLKKIINDLEYKIKKELILRKHT